MTPLSLASSNGNAAMVAACSKAGADPNESLPTETKPLMLASRSGDTEPVKALLEPGQMSNAREGLRGTTALMWAADEGHPAALKLLVERGADFEARSIRRRADAARRSAKPVIRESRGGPGRGAGGGPRDPELAGRYRTRLARQEPGTRCGAERPGQR